MTHQARALWLVLAACAPGLPWIGGCRGGPRPKPRPAVAVVRGVPIFVDVWRREVRRARSENVEASGPDALPASGLREHGKVVLEDLIARQLLLQEADKQQVVVSQDDVEAAVLQLQAGWQPQDFAAVIAHEDMDVDELRRLLRETLMIRKYLRDFVFARLAVTDAQIEAYAAAHPEVLKGVEQVRLAQIVVATQADANRVVDAFRRGKTTFAELAVAESQAPEGKRGGDLGLLPRGVLPEAFERVCFSLPVRTLSPIVPGADGYHLFWVGEHVMPKDFSLAQMRTQVQTVLRQAAEATAQTAHVAQLRSIGPVAIEESYLGDKNDA